MFVMRFFFFFLTEIQYLPFSPSQVQLFGIQRPELHLNQKNKSINQFKIHFGVMHLIKRT